MHALYVSKHNIVYRVPRTTENHLLTGIRRKTSENAEKRRKTPKNTGKLLKICIYETEEIVLGVCPHLRFSSFILINLIDLDLMLTSTV